MSITLTALRARLSQYLDDVDGLIYDSASLDESIRNALGEYNLWAAPAAPCTISGLDGAGSTSLPDLHVSLLLGAAAGYAALSRAGRRSEMYNLAAESARDLQGWGVQQLEDFRARLPAALESSRQSDLQNAAQPPYPADPDLDAWRIDPADEGEG